MTNKTIKVKCNVKDFLTINDLEPLQGNLKKKSDIDLNKLKNSMKLIYEPRGKAREYSPLAVNLYKGCGHACSYCYVPNAIFMNRVEFNKGANERNQNIIEQLEKDCIELSSELFANKQVFMSFTTDPYNELNNKLKLTRKALELFLKYKIPVSILTKSGTIALQDLDIIKKFGPNIKVGASLTYDNSKDSLRVERKAAIPTSRLRMLKEFHDAGVKTWVSFEPIMQPDQVLNLMNQCITFVDEFQFGKLAGDKRPSNWNEILNKIVTTMRNNEKDFYIKKTLRKNGSKVKLNQHEIEQDYLTLKEFK